MSGATLERRLANYRAALRAADASEQPADPGDPAATAASAGARSSSAQRLAAALDGELILDPGGPVVRVEPRDRRPAARPRPARGPCPGCRRRTRRSSASTRRRPGSRRRPEPSRSSSASGWWEGDRFRQVQLLLPDHPAEPGLLARLAGPHPAERVARHVQRPRLRLAAPRRPLPDGPPAGRRPTPATSTCCRSSAACSATGWPTPGSGRSRRSSSGRSATATSTAGRSRACYLDFLRGGEAVAADRRRPPQPRGRPVAGPAARPDRRRLRRPRGSAPPADRRPRRARPRRSAGPAGSTRRSAASTLRSTADPSRLDARRAGADRVPLATSRPSSSRPTTRRVCRGGIRSGTADVGGRTPRPSWERLVTGRLDSPWTVERVTIERGRLLRRLGRHDEAVATWLDLAAGPGAIAVQAWIEVAKLREHRLGDLAGRARCDEPGDGPRGTPAPDGDGRPGRRAGARGPPRAAAPADRRRGAAGSVSGGTAPAGPAAPADPAPSPAQVARTQSRSGSNEQAIVRRSPARALR